MMNYEIIKALGNQKKRKFGEVFFVQQRDNLQFGVLKRCKKTKSSAHIVASIRREQAFKLEHFSFQKTLEFEDSATEIQVIKSYVKGIPLDEFWKNVPKKKQIHTLKKLVVALQEPFNELREKGIVHCDIKPSNLIVEEEGDELIVHLIDFGLAIDLHNIEERKLIFSLGYSAPELVLNQLNCLSHATDLFSLGIVIWRLFVGVLPLFHSNPTVFTNLQITHPLRSNRSIPKELFTLIEQMCVKHAFKLPPNRLPKEEVENLLQSAMEKRIQGFDAVVEAVLALQEPKSRLFLIKFPSKSNTNR